MSRLQTLSEPSSCTVSADNVHVLYVEEAVHDTYSSGSTSPHRT